MAFCTACRTKFEGELDDMKTCGNSPCRKHMRAATKWAKGVVQYVTGLFPYPTYERWPNDARD